MRSMGVAYEMQPFVKFRVTNISLLTRIAMSTMSKIEISLSDREKDVQLFLEALHIEIPPVNEERADDYVMIKLDPAAAALFDAQDDKAVLFGYRLKGKTYPLSVLFLKGKNEVCFCHSTLILDSYENETWMVPMLRNAVQDFFSREASYLLCSLEPSWVSVNLAGQSDCRIYWNVKAELEIVNDLFLEKFGKVVEIPLFPTVYYYNNPYDQNLLEASLPDLSDCNRVLVLGTGAGLEAVCVALKYGIFVDATDINPLAVANTLSACRRTGTDHLVTAWVSDGFSTVTKKYDAILFEAPLATDETSVDDQNRYDQGGILLKKVLRELPGHLNPNGRLYLMSCPDISPYLKGLAMEWKVLRYFIAKSNVAIHKIWIKSS